MKKKWIGIFTLLCMLLSFVPVFAEESRVFDDADLLTAEEEANLQTMCQEVQQDWGLDLAYLTTYDTKGMSVREYGADVYVEKNLGVGEEDSGIIFVVDMGTREAQIVTCGKAIDIFTDYYIGVIWEEIQGYLSDGDFYGGMVVLRDNIDDYCGEYEAYQKNPDAYVSPYQKESDSFLSEYRVSQKSKVLMFAGMAALFSLVVAGIGVASMRKSCRNIRLFTDGRAYLKENGYHLRINQDTFANTHTTMMPIPRNDNDHHHSGGSWGGSSTTFHGGGGRSFGGGGGKF